jgi:hypothetical protein
MSNRLNLNRPRVCDHSCCGRTTVSYSNFSAHARNVNLHSCLQSDGIRCRFINDPAVLQQHHVKKRKRDHTSQSRDIGIESDHNITSSPPPSPPSPSSPSSPSLPYTYISQLHERPDIQRLLTDRAEAVIDSIIQRFTSPFFHEITDMTPAQSDFSTQPLMMRTIENVPEWESTSSSSPSSYRTLFQLVADAVEHEVAAATSDDELMNLDTMRSTTAKTDRSISDEKSNAVDSLTSHRIRNHSDSLTTKKAAILTSIQTMRKYHYLCTLTQRQPQTDAQTHTQTQTHATANNEPTYVRSSSSSKREEERILSSITNDADLIAASAALDRHIKPIIERKDSLFMTNIDVDHTNTERGAQLRQMLHKIAVYTQSHGSVVDIINVWKTAHGATDYERYRDWADDELAASLDPMGGFGMKCPQLYCKVSSAVTGMHNELAASGAMNYMTSYSLSVALWIAVNLDDMVNKLTDLYHKKKKKTQRPASIKPSFWDGFKDCMNSVV